MAANKNYRPALLGNIRAQGLDIFGYCNQCHRNRVLPSATLERLLGAKYPVPKIGARLRCTDCGGKDIDTRPNWKAVSEYHYPG